MNLNPSLTLTINPSLSHSNLSSNSSHSISSSSNGDSYTSHSLSFKITKAIIKESLDTLFKIECEGFIESLNNNLFTQETTETINFHPQVLIDQFAILSINSSSFNRKLEWDLEENPNSPFNLSSLLKEYTGILSSVQYLGLNHPSTSNLLNTQTQTPNLNHKHFFSFTLTSPLIRLKLNQANRIYTHKSILEILQEVLGFYQGFLHKTLDFSHILNPYPPQEWIAQYQESDLDFLTRITHNAGIYFYEDSQTIYFYDTHQTTNTKRAKYNPNLNNILKEPCIHSFLKEQHLFTNAFTHSSLLANHPLTPKSHSSLKVEYTNEEKRANLYTQHSYEGAHSFTQENTLKTSPNLKEKRALLLREALLAKSNLFPLSLNEKLEIQTKENPFNDSLLKDFSILAIEQVFLDSSALLNTLNTQDNLPTQDSNTAQAYYNTLTLLPDPFVYTPPYHSKPKAPMNTQGIVIGENKEINNQRNTIYTDKYGRIQVKIHCFANQELLDKKEESSYSSSFLRVATPIASHHSGFFHIPRVGDEVIISFLDDDIDKPYVSGSLYNQSNPALPNLPLDFHQTSFSARTLNQEDNAIEEGINQITLSSLKNQEQIFLQAQKDYQELIKHNFTQRIENNKDSKVEGIYQERIKKAHFQTIDLAKNVNIGGEYLTNVALSKDTNVGLSNTLNVGGSNTIRIAKDSSEFVGGDKGVEVRGDQSIIIHKDNIKHIKRNRKDTIKGSWDIKSFKDINISSKSNYSLSVDDNIELYSRDCLKLNSIRQTTLNNQNLLINTQEQALLNADKKLQFSIGDAIIQSNGKEIILQVGSSKITITTNKIKIQGKVEMGE